MLFVILFTLYFSFDVCMALPLPNCCMSEPNARSSVNWL